ncbi:MAG TPA: hypothetical protein PKL61_16235, partial [Accumulibacter sp.]|nr:hypothetical protein [Accumulibacter sp.]
MSFKALKIMNLCVRLSVVSSSRLLAGGVSSVFASVLGVVLSLLLLAACTPTTLSGGPSAGHLQAEGAARAPGSIPPVVQPNVSLPRPKPTGKTETYSVVVNNVNLHDLLFALARDAKLNVDIHPGLSGTVTLNAI